MSKNSLDILMQDIEVPDVVQKKAQDAFAQIQLEKKGNQVKVMGNQNKKRTSHIWQNYRFGSSIYALESWHADKDECV